MSLYSEEEDAEFTSHRPVQLSKSVTIQLKMLIDRLQGAHTLQALLAVRHDIEHSAVAQNPTAKEQLRTLANQRAANAGYKPQHEGERWWS